MEAQWISSIEQSAGLCLTFALQPILGFVILTKKSSSFCRGETVPLIVLSIWGAPIKRI